jgi:hypothetical protein
MMSSALLVACCLLLTGCWDLEIHIKVNEDGSANVTEKLSFSEALLDLAATSPQDAALLNHALSKEGALERMKKMGKGVELVSHEIGDATIAGTLFKQATVVYKIPDVNDLRLSPPFPNLWRDQDTCMTFVLEPCYARKPAGASGGTDLPGYMALEYRFGTDKPDGKPKNATLEPAPAMSPAQAQRIRDLLPAIKDLAQTASVKITLETYNPLNRGWGAIVGPMRLRDRDNAHMVPYVELLNISGQNKDAFGRPLLADEEILIEILRGDWMGPHMKQLLWSSPRWDDFRFLQDSKTPLIYPNVNANNSRRFIFLPSMIHYKRYFEGKTFDDGFAPSPPTH